MTQILPLFMDRQATSNIFEVITTTQTTAQREKGTRKLQNRWTRRDMPEPPPPLVNQSPLWVCLCPCSPPHLTPWLAAERWHRWILSSRSWGPSLTAALEAILLWSRSRGNNTGEDSTIYPPFEQAFYLFISSSCDGKTGIGTSLSLWWSWKVEISQE